MTLDETRAELDARWAEWQLRAEDLKDPYYSVERLEGAVRSASGERRAEIEQVLCAWVTSEDEGLRMAARGLLLDHRIQLGVPALRARGQELAHAEEIWNRFERQQVLDFAIQIEAADGGYESLVADPVKTAQTICDALDRLDAEARLPDGRSRTNASVAQLEDATRLLTAWQQDADPAHLAALAAMITEHWAVEYPLPKLLLAICAQAQATSG